MKNQHRQNRFIVGLAIGSTALLFLVAACWILLDSQNAQMVLRMNNTAVHSFAGGLTLAAVIDILLIKFLYNKVD